MSSTEEARFRFGRLATISDVAEDFRSFKKFWSTFRANLRTGDKAGWKEYFDGMKEAGEVIQELLKRFSFPQIKRELPKGMFIFGEFSILLKRTETWEAFGEAFQALPEDKNELAVLFAEETSDLEYDASFNKRHMWDWVWGAYFHLRKPHKVMDPLEASDVYSRLNKMASMILNQEGIEKAHLCLPMCAFPKYGFKVVLKTQPKSRKRTESGRRKRLEHF